MPGLTDDALYRALASRQRRRLVYYLSRHEQSSVDDLTRALGRWDVSTEGDAATGEQYEQTRIELEHVHLPMLAETGLIIYDRELETVRLTELDEKVAWLVANSVDTESI